jgi:hypothetical protein
MSAPSPCADLGPGPDVERFAARFRGLTRAHGRYTPEKSKRRGASKLEGRAVTLKEPVTLALYEQHLSGTYGLGIVAVMDEGRCWFGAIDIDHYGLDIGPLEKEITRLGLPLIIVRSKSGGLHLYLFCMEPILAELVRAKLGEWARALGHPQAEIFPKQTRLTPDDSGNWINLPYYGGDASERYALVAGERLTLQQFLDLADCAAVTEAQLVAFTPTSGPDDADPLDGAPPCIVSIVKTGLTEYRNQGLFNIGVYLRKSYGDDFAEKLDEYNQRCMSPPLGYKEVAHVASSVGKKDYGYKCKELPISAVCDRETCLTRRYGIKRSTRGSRNSSESDSRKPLDVLLDVLAEAGGELWHTSDRRAFVSININGYRDHWPVESTEFRRFLRHGHYKSKGKALSAEALQVALAYFDAQAVHEGMVHEIAVRIAELDGGLYVDLGNLEREIVYLHQGGWEIVHDAPVRFYRPATLRPLPRPARGSTLEALRPFVTIRDEDDWRLLLAFLVNCLRPRGPYLQLHLTGVQGSAKTTLARMIVAIIDPSIAGVRAAPKDERDLLIAASHAHLLAFDNVSNVPFEMSDALCRLSTGGGLGTRKLYTNDEQQVFDVMRPVVLNGITEIGVRPDLRDRAVVLDLPRLDDGERKDEATLWADFESALPALLGALYDAVSCALREWETTVLVGGAPRMADMTRWVEAAALALGWEPGSFTALYRKHREHSAKRAVEQDALASAVFELVGEADYQLAPMDLHKALTSIARRAGSDVREQFWPKTPSQLSGRLKRMKPDLEKFGIRVEWGRGDERWISITVEGRSAKLRIYYEEPM